MRMQILAAGAALLLAFNLHAAGFGDPEMDMPLRLIEVSLKQEVPANDPRVAAVRDQLARVMKLSGENDLAVGQLCMRNARYIFDASRQRATPLEVLEALAKHAQVGKSLNETSQRYATLRVQQKLGHAEALAAMAKR